VDTIDWLLDSDSAIRWQAMRDLMDANAEAITLERGRVEHQGLGAEILSCQRPNGSWRRDDAPVWLTTLFTMQLLRATGIDPANSSSAPRSRLAMEQPGRPLGIARAGDGREHVFSGRGGTVR
jgi:hypothetical protein